MADDEARRLGHEQANLPPVDAQTLAEIEPRERHEHEQRDDSLDDLELRCRELPVADAVRRHLKTILEERQEPGHEDHLPQSRLAESEMAVPGGGHEDVRSRQQCDGFHASMALRYVCEPGILRRSDSQAVKHRA